MSSTTQFGVLTTINGQSPVAGNIEFTSSGGTVFITEPGPGTINLEAAAAVGYTINGDVSSVTGPIITFTGSTSGSKFTGNGTTTMTLSFDYLSLPNTTSSSLGVIRINGEDFIHAFNGTGNGNVFIGTNSGNFTLTTASSNTGIGKLTLDALTTGDNNFCGGERSGSGITTGGSNISIGAASLEACTSGSANIAIGTDALNALQSTNNNIAIGYTSLQNVTTGAFNVALGFESGFGYTTSESSNILIGSSGTIGESNTLRIGGGAQYPLTKAYVTGISGNSPGGSDQLVYINAVTGQLSSATPSAITTIDGDVSSVSGVTITLTGSTSGGKFTGNGTTTMTLSFDYIALPDTSTSSLGYISIDSIPFMHAYPGVASYNTFLGNGAGNFTIGAAIRNIGIGGNACNFLTTGDSNVAIGFNALGNTEDGSNNIAIGDSALVNVASSDNNIAIGSGALDSLVDGDLNIAIGIDAGSAYTGIEAGNILLGSAGVTGEGSTMRLGSGITATYVAGIYNHTPAAAKACYIESTGLIGALTVTGYITSWVDISGTSQSMAVNTGYSANNGSLVTLTLPTTAVIGSLMQVCYKGAGGWRVAQNASQFIRLGTSLSTTGVGGYIEATAAGDCVTLRCVTADVGWIVESVIGNITVV